MEGYRRRCWDRLWKELMSQWVDWEKESHPGRSISACIPALVHQCHQILRSLCPHASSRLSLIAIPSLIIACGAVSQAIPSVPRRLRHSKPCYYKICRKLFLALYDHNDDEGFADLSVHRFLIPFSFPPFYRCSLPSIFIVILSLTKKRSRRAFVKRSGSKSSPSESRERGFEPIRSSSSGWRREQRWLQGHRSSQSDARASSSSSSSGSPSFLPLVSSLDGNQSHQTL